MKAKATIPRTFVRKEAYVKLRDWIIEGKLEPGQKLRDIDLAVQMGVSRTPIREALLKLEDEGLVFSKPNSSTIVSPIDFQTSYHLYTIVWTLEQLALQQAFDSLTESHLEAMAKANDKLLQALKSNKRRLAVDADNEFHEIYIRLSGNSELQQILSSLKQKLKRLELHYFKNARDALHSCKEHQDIIDALKRKDLKSAQKSIEDNWQASFARIQPE